MDPTKANFAQSGQQTQRAAIFNNWGEKLQVVSNVAVANEVSSENVLVKIHSSSVNPVDWKIRHGDLKLSMHFPKIPGRDISGTVVKVGSNVTRFQLGDEVYGMPEALTGTYCEFVNCSSKSLSKKPAKLSFNEAAAIPLVALTAHEAIVQRANLTSGQSILILGGSSGVGHIGIQIAKALGATVYTTCGPSNIDWVKELGADIVIDYKKDDFMKVLGDKKVDVVFDAAGIKEDRDKSFDLIKPKGFVVTTTPNDDRQSMSITEAAKTVGDIVWKKISNYISNGVSYIPFFVHDFQGDTLDLLNIWINDGKLKVKIDSVFSLDQAQEASEKSESGKLSGKVVIAIV